MCGITNMDLCDDEKRALIQKYIDMDVEALTEEVGKYMAQQDEIEAKFEAEVEKLQQK